MIPVILGARGQVGTTLARELRARGESPLISSRTPAAGELPVDFEKPETISAFFRELGRRAGGEPATIFLTGAFTHGCGPPQNISLPAWHLASLPQIPAASTWMTTSPGPACGRGTSSRR